MNKQNDGGPAFPRQATWNEDAPAHYDAIAQDGMSLRDYFAAGAMQAFLSQSHTGPKDWTKMGFGWGEDCANDLNKHSTVVAQTLAGFAYQVADAMLDERAKATVAQTTPTEGE